MCQLDSVTYLLALPALPPAAARPLEPSCAAAAAAAPPAASALAAC
jgi:hypothetical protein